MAGEQQDSSAGKAPSADTLKERLADQDHNLGAGNQEPDPATEGTPPSDRREGDKARDPD